MKSCDFCHESILESTLECPYCGEVNGVPGSTRHYFRQYYLAACPLCEGKPLLKTDQVCPQCNINLHRFSLEWGSRLRHSENATRFARKLAKAEKPPGVLWEHLERKGRCSVSVDVGADRQWAFSFGSLCTYAGVVSGTECRHAGRLCQARLPDRWISCFLGYRKLEDLPDKLRAVAFEDTDWAGQY